MATDFNRDLVKVSEWYDERNLLGQLKVVLKDVIADTDIDNATDTRDLLDKLMNSGYLSSENPSLLYETIKITKQSGVVKILRQSFLEVQEITKFTQYRQWIVAFGNGLTQADIDRIDGLYNTLRKKYKDSWSLIMDLEHRQKICEQKEFITNLRELGIKCVESLTKEESESATQTEHTRLQKRIKLDKGTEDVPTTSNRDQGMRKDVKSETEKIEKYLLQRQKKLCSRDHTFTPAIMNDRYKIDISKMFTDMELLEKSENNTQIISKPTTLKEVIDVIKSTTITYTIG
ncbi:uncharacterized protein [Antedon mediterranea]|uniref:uncharacterized protein n=1 Tax=Antedon mediterranea TaxID=105859 RepID=UPI003AF4A4BE